MIPISAQDLNLQDEVYIDTTTPNVDVQMQAPTTSDDSGSTTCRHQQRFRDK